MAKKKKVPLDPQLAWAGKTEHASFEVPPVLLQVSGPLDPCRIIEAVREGSAEWASDVEGVVESP